MLSVFFTSQNPMQFAVQSTPPLGMNNGIDLFEVAVNRLMMV